ncbi:MAG: TauD/TfdA family dioxygenase [SAR324 cluster bacterium]|nr:TauD/TfdA family dioxygenase [SAR324 cluster bacterium]MEE2716641.1 TauD/TfdA family dioxygenase [SAR324 cluster bacterium]
MLRSTHTPPSAWKGNALPESEWITELPQPLRKELAESAQRLHAEGRSWDQTTRESFPLQHAAPAMADLQARLEGGRGMVLLKHFSSAESELDVMRLQLWGLGCHLGFPEPQDATGCLLHDVKDTGQSLDTANVRAYQTNLPLSFHNDGADAFLLLCHRQARSGGVSALVSAGTVFNAILDQRPDLAEVLQQPFYFDARGQELAGQPPYQEVPIFCFYKEHLNILYKREYIERAQRFPDVPRLSPLQQEALDLLDQTCDELALRFRMESGDLLIANNYDTLHARSAFESADPSEKGSRHMLRLWLTLPKGRSLPPIYAQTREFHHSYRRRAGLLNSKAAVPEAN